VSTYTPIATQPISSNTASVTFNSIPQSYTDLVLIVSGTATTSFGDCPIRFNDDGSSAYSDIIMYSSGSTAGSGRHVNQTFPRGWYYAQPFTNIYNIMNYTNTTTYKTIIGRSNTNTSETEAAVAMWRSFNAITSITVFPDGASFASGTTVALYGIASGDVTAKATGGVVTTSGGYRYHTFTSSGSFTALSAISVDCLVIAGGGGGANGLYFGGGGGAGGLVYTSGISLSANTACTVLVGGGGANSNGTNSNILESSLSLTTALGGGVGGASTSTIVGRGANGGSGGGGQENRQGGTGTSGQGNNGGSGDFSGGSTSGGGGGGGAAGSHGIACNSSGAGGVGSSSYSSWCAATNTGQNSCGTYS